MRHKAQPPFRTLGFAILLLLVGTIFLMSCGKCEPRNDVDESCVQKESQATIDGRVISLSEWRNDCSCAVKPLEGKNVELSTWGIIIEYTNDKIVRARIIPPHVTVKVPYHSSLFAGFSSEEGARSAFCRGNPGAKKPTVWR